MSEKYIGNVAEVTLDNVANFLIESTEQSIKKIPTEKLKEGIYKDLPIDSEFSDTSENAVKNKVIYKALEYKADVIINSASGTTVAITDSAKVKPKNIKLFGKGKQRQYEGNQMLDSSEFDSLEHNGVTMTVEDERVILNGTATNNIDFYLINDSKNIDVRAKLNAKLGVYTLSNNLGVENWFASTTGYTVDNITITSETQLTGAFVRIKSGATYNNSILEIMLNEGDTPKPWEPYVGNEPSPNMKYPQKAEFLGESGSIGSGLGAENYAISDSDYSTVTQGITITKYQGASKVRLQGVISEESYPLTREMNGKWQVANESAKLFPAGTTLYAFPNDIAFDIYDWHNERTCYFTGETTLENDLYIDEVFVRFESGYFSNGIIDETIEFILTDSLQPFTSQTPNGLRGIPLGQTIPDAIKNSPIHMSGVYWDGEQYQIADTENEDGKDIQRIGEVDNNQWRLNNIVSSSTGYRFIIEIDDILVLRHVPIMCTHFSQQKVSSYVTEGNYISTDEVDSNKGVNIRTEEDTSPFTTIEEMVTWMNENDVKTYYILAEPIITDTTDQYNVVMNYPNTTIVNDEGAYQEVTYIADTKNYIAKIEKKHEEDIQTLKNAILSLGGNV